MKEKFNKYKKIYSFLQFFSYKQKNFIPLNINFKSLKCNKIKFIDYKNNNVFKVEFKAKIENSILKIKNLKIDSSFLKTNSYGKIFFNNHGSTSCFINTGIMTPIFHNKIMHVSFTAGLSTHNKFKFKLKSKDLYNIKIYGLVFLNSVDYPFFIKLKSNNLSLPIKKDYILKLDNFNGVLKGKINNYFLSLKNIFTLQGFPSIFIDIKGSGNLQNIFLKKIKFIPVKQKNFYKKIINLKENIQHNKYILKLIGKMNIAGNYDNNISNLYIPKIHLDGNIIRKQFSVLGSLYYKNFNCIDIPGIDLFLGKNKLHFNGSLGNKYNIYSSFYANNLNYFTPNLKGRIKAKLNCYGDYLFPTITSQILASDLDWNNTYLKNIKISTKINMNNKFLGKILIDAKKIHFNNFYINTLRIHTCSYNNKQHFSFLLKSHKLYINLIINGFFNKKTGNWKAFFKKVKIQTFLGQVNAKKNNLINYYDSNNNISNFYQENIRKRDNFLSFLHNIKISFFNIFNPELLNFKSELSINSQFQWKLKKNIYDSKLILIGNNIKLEKKINKKIFIENIDYFKISIHLINNDLKSKWMVNKIRDSLQKNSIVGYLNIIDIYDKKNIEGEFIVDHFPFSFINFFTLNFKQANGIFQSKINIFGTWYQPKVSADVSFQNIFIRSNKILKYITLFFPYFSGKIDIIKINQEIIIDKGNILFTLHPFLKNSTNIEWTIAFNSKKISVLIFPKIKLKFSSQLNLHYLLSKYDLIGYIRFLLFYFKINEKNFIF